MSNLHKEIKYDDLVKHKKRKLFLAKVYWGNNQPKQIKEIDKKEEK